MKTVTAILLNWKRPENIVKTIKSIRDQSIPVKICLWNNNSDDKTKYDVDLQINSPDNFKCYPRWIMASLIETDYIFTLDDDLVLSDDNVIEDTLNLYKRINTDDKLILGYTGVILNQDKNYWTSEHLTEPKNEDIKVDIVKGRFMFMSKSLINNMTLENEETCEDIKVSSYSNYKLIPSILKNRLSNLDELEVGLFGSSDHNIKRSVATKRYF
jgi:glycosyltransferase involved in cell wall biosynthesis